MVLLNVKEAKEISVLERTVSGELTISQARERLGLGRTTIWRKLKRFEEVGAGGMAHGLRGRPSNHRSNEALKTQVLKVFENEYKPYGFRVAHFLEDAKGRFGSKVSYPTVVRWLRASGLVEKAHKGRRHHTRRPRKECFGDMLQMDTSIHDWLGWGKNLALVAAMDDATNVICGAQIGFTDTTLGNMRVLKNIFTTYGLPKSIYVDRSPIFKVIRRGGVGKINRPTFEAPYVTQVRRALDELGVELIYAYSPQAKGRIERSFGTWQTRLVPELRKNGIVELPKANQYISEVWVPRFNERFTHNKDATTSSFIPVKNIDLDYYLAEKHSMRVTNDHILASKAKGVSVRVLSSEYRVSYAKARVTVYKHTDGRLSVVYKNHHVPFEPYVDDDSRQE